MNISGTSTLTADRATVWAALNNPAVLVAAIPGCQRLEALGGDTYAMTVAAGVGSIKGVYDGQVRLSDHQEPSSFTMHAQGAGAPGTIGAQVMVVLEDGPGGGTVLSYDADATVGGMIGGVGQRMLTGVSKKMAAEFFANVDSVLAGAPVVPAGFPGGAAAPNHPSVAGSLGGPVPSTVAAAPPVQPAPSAAAPAVHPAPASAAAPAASAGAVPPGTVFTAPGAAVSSQAGAGPGFLVGVAVGAVAALAGAVVGAWIAGRRTH